MPPLFPAVRTANARSLPMPSVRVRDNEPFEVAIRRFKRTCERAGVITDVRKREYFEKPSRNASASAPPQSSGR